MRARVQATLSHLGFDRFHPTPILWSGSMRGCSLMVKPQSSKLITRVRFPSSPPLQRLRRKRRGLFAFRGFRESLTGENAFPRALGASENLLRGSIYSDISAGSTEFRPDSRGTSRACVRRFLPCGWWCRIAGTPRPGACTRSSRARARPQFREYRGGPRARW